MKRENLPAGNERMNAVSTLNDLMNQNPPLPENSTPTDPLARDFHQDIATFYPCDAPASRSGDPLRDASNVLDGETGEKVLTVACPLPGRVEIGLQDRRIRLNTLTGELVPLDEHDSQHLPALAVSSVLPDGLLDAGMRGHVPDPASALPVRWVVENGVLSAYTEEVALFLTERDGVPLHDIGCVAQGGDGTVWIGGVDGAARLRAGVWRYFGGRRWLPDNHVNAIALDTEGRAWIGTDAGLACIGAVPLTLKEKARLLRNSHAGAAQPERVRHGMPADTRRRRQPQSGRARPSPFPRFGCGKRRQAGVCLRGERQRWPVDKPDPVRRVLPVGRDRRRGGAQSGAAKHEGYARSAALDRYRGFSSAGHSAARRAGVAFGTRRQMDGFTAWRGHAV